MSNPDVIALLAILAGPRGPLSSDEQFEAIRRQLTDGDPVQAVERLLDELRDTNKGLLRIDRAALESEVTELLVDLAGTEEARILLEHRASTDPSARPVVLDALALLAHPGSGAPLADLADKQLEAPFLKSREMVALASALGSVGGAEALHAVHALGKATWPPEVARELEIARRSLEGS